MCGSVCVCVCVCDGFLSEHVRRSKLFPNAMTSILHVDIALHWGSLLGTEIREFTQHSTHRQERGVLHTNQSPMGKEGHTEAQKLGLAGRKTEEQSGKRDKTAKEKGERHKKESRKAEKQGKKKEKKEHKQEKKERKQVARAEQQRAEKVEKKETPEKTEHSTDDSPTDHRCVQLSHNARLLSFLSGRRSAFECVCVCVCVSRSV
jgi:outer membrane biosynthesis protein TonB